MSLNANRKIIDSSERNEEHQKCIIEDAEFNLNNDEYENAIKSDSSNSKKIKLYDIVRDKYKQYNNVCVLNFKTVNETEKYYVICAHCSFRDSCCKYRFDLNKATKVINAFRNKKFLCHPIKTQIGIKRKAKQSESLYKPAIKHNGQFLKNPIELENVGSPRKGSHNLSRLDKDPILDLYFMKKDIYKDYIQKIADPLELYMWSADPVRALLADKAKVRNLSRNTLFLDCTGSLVQKLEQSSKRVYYYALIAKAFDYQIALPIAEAVLLSPYTCDIRMWLTKFRQYCVQLKLWPVTKRICTAVSQAMTNAAISSFNIENKINDFEQYLNVCYEFLQDNKSKLKITIIQWCSSQFSKIVIQDVKNTAKAEEHSFILRAIGVAFHFNNLPKCDEWFSNLCLICMSKRITADVKRAMENIENISKLEDNKMEEHSSGQVNSATFLSNTMFAKSPFWKRYKNIKEDIETKIDQADDGDGDGDNNLYNTVLLNIVLNKYCSYLPMWTNIMGQFIETDNKTRITNAAIESFFQNTKENVSGENLKVNKFAKFTYTQMKSQVSQISYKILSSSNNTIKSKTQKSGKTVRLQGKNGEAIDLTNVSTPPKRSSIKTNTHAYYILNTKDLFEYLGDGLSSVFEHYLSEQDLKSLSNNEWMTNFVMDSALAAVIKKTQIPNVHLISCTRSGALLDPNQNEKMKLLQNVMPAVKDILVLPILTDVHYTVVVIDFVKQIFYYIDSKNNDATKLNQYFEKCKMFLKEIDLDINEFSKIIPPHDLQNDQTSCGPFVVQFVEHLILGKSLENLNSRMAYRHYLVEEIKAYNKNIMDLCIRCAKNYQNSKEPWLECVKCKRRLCDNCLEIVFNKNINNEQKSEFVCYKCLN